MAEPTFAAAVRWPIDRERIRLRMSDRVVAALPGALRHLSGRMIAGEPGSRLRRALITRGVVAGWAATDARDFDYLERVYHPEVAVRFLDERFLSVGMPAATEGWPAMRAALQDTFEAWSWTDFRPVELIDVGGPFFAARTELQTEGRRSGLEASDQLVHLYEIRDGQLGRQWVGREEGELDEHLARRRAELA